MADIVISLNGTPTTLSDDGAGGYTIDLRNSVARGFVRAEKQQLLEEKARLVLDRDQATGQRDTAIAQRDEAVTRRDAIVAEIADVQARIDEINAFLTGAGD